MRSQRKHPSRTRILRAVSLWLICAGLASLPVWAGASVVSANPHRLACNTTIPPEDAIASYSGVKANAYHVDISSSCEISTALGFPSYSKPRIISDDIKRFTASEVTPVIDQVFTAGEHFEHWAGPLDTLLVDGQPINGVQDFDPDSLTILAKLGTRASWLPSNGTLTQSGTEFYWNGQPVTLMGFTVAPILATKNVDLPSYLDVLASNGVNMLRVDGVSQWAALTVGASQLDPTNGLNPYFISTPGGPGQTLTTKWDLTQFNTQYFNRLKDLVSMAADRGIVVHFSLFDRHGLLNTSGGLVDYGQFLGSPYNKANNVNGLLAAGPAGKAPPDFTGLDGTTIGGITKAYVQKVVKEIGAYGNVMFEIMNEPLESAMDWTNTVAWHQWVADTLNTALATPLITRPSPNTLTAIAGSTVSFTVASSGVTTPAYQWQSLSGGTYVNLTDDSRIQGSQAASLRIGSITTADGTSYRCLVSGGSVALNSGPATLTVNLGGLVVKDSFMGTDGTLLNGRTTEAGTKTWSADDVKLSGQKARSNNDAGKFRILGSVPVSLSNLQTASVQAEVVQSDTGIASVGFRPSALGAFSSTDNSLWLDLTRGGSLTLKKRAAGVVTTLRTLDLTTLGFVIGNTVHLRLIYKVATGKADVYVNYVKRMNDVALGFTPGTAFAGFQGQRGNSTDTYLDTSGSFDNFEVVLSP